VRAAVALGTPPFAFALRHLLPQFRTRRSATGIVCGAILTESALAFVA
jgi:ABC-type dipeptide/oligopeptide/nickel transport system permease subunit